MFVRVAWSAIAAVAGLAVLLALLFALPSGSPTTSPKAAFPTTQAPPVVRAATQPAADQPDPRASGVIAVGGRDVVWLYGADGRLLGPSGARNQTQGMSADGLWQAGRACTGEPARCQLLLSRQGGAFQAVALPGSFNDGRWSDERALFALIDADGRLFVVDAESNALVELGRGVTTFAWTRGATLTFASLEAGRSRLWRYASGTAQPLASVAGAVASLYRSPDDEQVAFTVESPEGWRLLTLDLETAQLTDFGHLGRTLLNGGGIVPRVPEIAIAWSPDRSLIAVSPTTAPYVLSLLAAGGATLARYFFDEGYAGELSWSADGATLAVSTYSPDRSRHEVYVIDTVARGEARHLIDGCHIVWSPDGRYLAVKREPSRAPGVAAVRVADGAHWSVSDFAGSVPLSWGEDVASALSLAHRPARFAVALTK